MDHRNRLTLVTDKTSSTGSITQRVQYIYDAFNQRTGKRVDLDGNGTWDRHEIFAWADGQEVLRFVDSDGQLVTQPARIANRYLWGPAVDQLLADEQYAIGAGPSVNLTAAAPSVTEGNTLWALADNLGSVRDLVDNNGVVRQHLVFDSFGRRVREVDYNTAGAVIASTDPAAVDELFGYTGRDWDTHTGLQYNRARWYDPNTGRWLSQDPIGFGGGDANLYRFVGNGATNATDPSGLDQLTNEQKQWDLARATKLLASMNLSEEERNIRIAIPQASLFHQMGFSSQFPPNPKYWNEEGDRYVLKKSLAREGVHARVFGLGPLFTYTDEDGKKHSINGSSTGCSNAARLLFLEGIAKVAEEQKKLKEFEDEFSGKSMLELFPEDESSGYHRSYGAIPKQPPFAINPNDFLPGDRVRMGNHRLPKGDGFEGSNVIYLGRNEFDQHMFLKMDGGDVFNGYLLRLIVSGYSDDPDPNLRNYVFVERYSPLVPNFLKPSKKFNCD